MCKSSFCRVALWVLVTSLLAGCGASGTRAALPSPIATSPPVRSCLQATSASRLIVEEHRLSLGPIPAEAIPSVGQGFSTYFEIADGDTGQILARNQTLRDPGALLLASNNALLEPFGYRLELEQCGDTYSASYRLYKGDQLYADRLTGLGPVSVSASGADFVMQLSLPEGGSSLTGDGLTRQGPTGLAQVYVGDELLTLLVSDTIEVSLGKRLVYRDLAEWSTLPPVAGGPWSYDGHWVIEQVEPLPDPDLYPPFKGHVIEDGQDLNQACGYEESFGFALLDGRPFYFFKKDGKVNIAYGGQRVQAGYDSVAHYGCCTAAVLNPAMSLNMVWFYARRGELWSYVEAYVPLEEEPAATLCPTPTPVVVPTVVPLPAPATLPGMPQPGATYSRVKDEMLMRYVPAGPFYMGSPEGVGEDSEHLQHIVTLDAFWIDETEVTQRQYQACVETGVCRAPGMEGYSPADRGDYPVQVTWSAAQTYCLWAGGRLPTEAEWEKAARGTDARTYPWGEERPDCTRANHESLRGFCSDGPVRVGAFPAGASPYGVLDMAGNVEEWVADWYDPGYYDQSPEQNPLGPETGESRGARGGQWYAPFPYVRTASRDAWAPDWPEVGFRCVVPATALTVVESNLFGG